MQLSIHLDEKIVRKLERWASQEKRSRSNLVQKLLTDLIEKSQAETREPLIEKHGIKESFAAIHLKAVDTGIPDLAGEHNHYLYGTPRRS